MISTVTLITSMVLKWKCNYSTLNYQENVAHLPIHSHFISNIMNDTHVLSYKINSTANKTR